MSASRKVRRRRQQPPAGTTARAAPAHATAFFAQSVRAAPPGKDAWFHRETARSWRDSSASVKRSVPADGREDIRVSRGVPPAVPSVPSWCRQGKRVVEETPAKRVPGGCLRGKAMHRCQAGRGRPQARSKCMGRRVVQKCSLVRVAKRKEGRFGVPPGGSVVQW